MNMDGLVWVCRTCGRYSKEREKLSECDRAVALCYENSLEFVPHNVDLVQSAKLAARKEVW
jgi:hypothetical protein